MASSKRERELARMRAERQAARRAEAAARRKARQRSLAIAGSVIAVLAVVGIYVATKGGDDKATVAAPTPTPAPVGSKPATTPASTAPAGGATCTYDAAGDSSKKIAGKPPTTGVVSKGTRVASLTTNQGPIELTLNAAKAPCTVNSFTYLAGQKYFDGTSCHRLTTSGIFVLQCGDPTGTGSGGPGYRFPDENLTGATYPRGTVAMANAGAGTNGSQFFLVYKDTQLPPSYTPFGTITKGLELLDRVAKGGSTPEPSGNTKPNIPVSLKTVTIQG